MDIKVTHQSVRAMADRIAKAHADISKPKALEILSSGFGYKNFDTLSGVLKKESSAPATSGAFTGDSTLEIPPFTPFTLVLDAFACDEDGDSPAYAEITVTTEFIAQIKHTAVVCQSANIRAAHVNDSDGIWHDPEGALRMRGTDLVVMPSFGAVGDTSFFFQAHPKHADYDCETRAVDLKDLIACIGNAEPELPIGFQRERGVLFFDGASENIDFLVETYFDGEEISLDEGDEVWWTDPDEDVSSGIYTVVDADHPEIVTLRDADGSEVEALRREVTLIDHDAIAEWVGLHYKVNFDAEPKDRREEWIGRWVQTQREAG